MKSVHFKNVQHGLYLTILLLILSCSKDDNTSNSSPLHKISIENGQFKKANGDTFFPWGLNYTNPERVGLIEDDWLNPVVWNTIETDFSEMKQLGANVIRLHLQYHQFMIDATTPNPVALERLVDLVTLASQEGLYLDITGLAAYRQDKQPSYYTDMTDEERWNTQKIFWSSIAEMVGKEHAVFAFNLMNEPVVSVGCDNIPDCAWTPGSGFGGFHFVQNITRTSGLDYVTTFKSWIEEMTQAIRSKDPTTLITVGMLDLGAYSRFKDDMDYLSPHIYPKSGEIQLSVDKIMTNQSNVPLVIEEISNLNCNITELKGFLNDIEGQYDGLMGHYFGTPIEDLDITKINQAIQKKFLQFFKNNQPK